MKEEKINKKLLKIKSWFECCFATTI